MSADVVFLYDQVIEHLVRLRWLASSAELAIPDLVRTPSVISATFALVAS